MTDENKMIPDSVLSISNSVKWIKEQRLSSSKKASRIREKKLPTKNIKTNLEIFQCRSDDSFGSISSTSEHHIKDLRASLKNSDLDPIHVYDIAGEWYVIDGHHRLKAYIDNNVKQIPVKEFKGTPQDAVQYAIKENGKTKLSLSKEEKSDLAWDFVSRDDQDSSSKAEISDLFNVSASSIANMRRIRGIHLSQNTPFPSSWSIARNIEKLDRDDDSEYQADWLHNRLSELIGVKLDKDSRIVASALANFGSYRFNDLLNAMVQHQQDMIDSGDWDEDDC